MAPTTSSIATQLIHCRPQPSGPPTPRRKGGSIRPSAPPAGREDHAEAGSTTRMPAARAASAAASHSRATSARKSAGASSEGDASVRVLVAPVAVDSDGRRRDQHPRRPGQAGERLGQEPGAPTRLSRIRRLRAAVQRTPIGSPARWTTASTPSSLPASIRPACRIPADLIGAARGAG